MNRPKLIQHPPSKESLFKDLPDWCFSSSLWGEYVKTAERKAGKGYWTRFKTTQEITQDFDLFAREVRLGARPSLLTFPLLGSMPAISVGDIESLARQEREKEKSNPAPLPRPKLSREDLAPSAEELRKMNNMDWWQMVNSFRMPIMQPVLSEQYRLIQEGFGKDTDFTARACLEEAVRLVRKFPSQYPYPVRPVVETEEESVKVQDIIPKQKRGSKPTTRKEWEGQNACAILRWMGSKGWAKDRAMKKMVVLGFTLSPSTVNIQMGKGKKGEALPKFSPAQVTILEKP